MSLKLDAEQVLQLGRLRDLAAGVRCAVIGAVAVQHHVAMPRDTYDVDLVLEVNAAEVAPILRKLGWRQDEKQRQRWRGPGNFVADVLPAAPLQLKLGVVRFDSDEREMSLAGFDLLFDNAAEVQLPGQERTIQVASLATVVVLKIAAWCERPHDRKKDLHDLGTLLAGALGDDDLRRWDPGVAGDFDEQSPRFVGQEVGRVIAPRHRVLIDAFLSQVLAEQSPWLIEIGRGMGKSRAASVRRALEAFRAGVVEIAGANE